MLSFHYTFQKMRHILLLVPFFIIASNAIDRPRGVSLEKASFYQLDTEFRCLTSGKVLPADHVNDDYCDCEDGSDEPGTSACANGLFYCENKPYKGHYIRSSRVNDGICDCCDGSDEFDGIIACSNTCVEKYEQERVRQEAFRLQQSEGYKVKQEYMQQGKRAKDEKRSKLSELDREKDILIKEKETAEVSKEEAEEPEKAAIEVHKKQWELVKEERQKAKDSVKAAQAFSTLDTNGDGNVDYPELMKHKQFDIDSDGTVSEEEAKEYLEDSEQVDVNVFTEKIWPNIKEIYKLEGDMPEDATGDQEQGNADEEKDPAVDQETVPKDIPDVDVVEGGSPDHHDLDENAEDPGYNYDDEDGSEEDEDDEEEDDDESSYDIASEKELEDLGSLPPERRRDRIMKRLERMRKNLEQGKKKNETLDVDTPEEDKEPDYNEETKRLIEVADQARTTFNEAERKVKDTEREIEDIKKYLEVDLGPNEEFAFLKGQCFEYTDREYTYRLCPFDKSTQKNKNGGIETSLGTWGKWHGPDDDRYDAMKYENGQGCWNGPSRSTHVNLHCGSTNTLTGASEPSRCEYQFEFTTPAKCDEPRPVDINNTHDEL